MKPYYQDDLVTLFHGDCLEVTDWTTADVLVTDPPYGIQWKGITTGLNKGYEKHIGGIKNDKDTKGRDEVLALWGNKPFMVFGSSRISRPEPIDALLIWHKAGMPPGPLNAAFMTQHEEIYVRGSGFISPHPHSVPSSQPRNTDQPRFKKPDIRHRNQSDSWRHSSTDAFKASSPNPSQAQAQPSLPHAT